MKEMTPLSIIKSNDDYKREPAQLPGTIMRLQRNFTMAEKLKKIQSRRHHEVRHPPKDHSHRKGGPARRQYSWLRNIRRCYFSQRAQEDTIRIVKPTHVAYTLH